MLDGIKHLLACRCVLPQFKNRSDPPRHQFIAFSVMSDNVIVPKFVQCNNCGVIHKVIDVCRSEIIQGREEMKSIVTIDELKLAIPQALANILDANRADLPDWEMAKFVIDNEKWGSFIVLSTDEESGVRQGKYVSILGKNMFKVEQFTREEVLG